MRTLSCVQLDTAYAVLESIETRDPPPEKDYGLITLADLYPVVTEQQKAETLVKFSVSSCMYTVSQKKHPRHFRL